MPDLSTVRNAVLKSLAELVHRDNHLFGAQANEDDLENPEFPAIKTRRKLHEVSINHRLALYLEKNILPLIRNSGRQDPVFVDIEFNRKGCGLKGWVKNGKFIEVRPDIIIHDRKDAKEKFNFLVVECKKSPASKLKLKRDLNKIRDFIQDKNYDYQFGLQVVYGSGSIKEITLCFNDAGVAKSDKQIRSELGIYLSNLESGIASGMTFEQIFSEN